METKLYNFNIELSWNLLNKLSQIDRFDASWSTLEKIEKHNLNSLKSIATIQSVGSSTRIEGSKMNDDQVKVLIDKIEISNFEDRDSQEVAGYYNVLNIILSDSKNMRVTKSDIKNLHNQLLKFSEKDNWHKGEYKKHSNAVEANFPDGSKQIIFKTTDPGFATDDEMNNVINWYNSDSEIHNLLKISVFIYEFLTIHPFQDGNGRLSRLLTSLLLLKSNYVWIQYVSFEHEIEFRKKEYYNCLRNCQAQRPNENISEWVNFFLDSLLSLKKKLNKKLEVKDKRGKLAPREKSIFIFIMSNPGCKSGEISTKLNIPNPTIKRILTKMVKDEIIEKFGSGAGTNYAIR
jgi:Fic family protein